MDDDYEDDERPSLVRGVLVKALALLVIVGLAIFFGTKLMVSALGLDEGSAPGPVGSDASSGSSRLPTTALPVPGEESPSSTPSRTASPDGGGRITLGIAPINVRPSERINMTGTYRRADNVALEVQRFEGGKWTNFGVQANVRVGTFSTYIMTSRTGEMQFRVFDPDSGEGSNVVRVTVQ